MACTKEQRLLSRRQAVDPGLGAELAHSGINLTEVLRCSTAASVAAEGGSQL